jgi:Dienelactone hydrolase and related enzymes
MDQKIINLYDKYTHGLISRRDFLDRLALITGSAAAANAMLPLLQNNYAQAAVIDENDKRIKTETFRISPEDKLSGYLAKPVQSGKLPVVIVIHENRGLNPHIKDVTRRFAIEGFLALGVDFLSPVGGTPDDEDKAREMIASLDSAGVLDWCRKTVSIMKQHPDGNGHVGAVGFCWGGGWVNALAAAEPQLDASVAYYGMQAPADKVSGIHAPLLLHYAGLDERINAGIPAYEEALKKANKTFDLYIYESVNHAFNNDTNPARYNKQAADLAWSRTIAFLEKYLA